MRQSLGYIAQYVFRQPKSSLFLPASYGDTNGLWVSSGKTSSKHVIFYIHGGGYIAGSPETHKKMIARLSQMTGLRAFVPSYGLAPEQPFPAAFDDVVAAFQALMDRGYQPSNIIIGGDSAGGGLALALLSYLCEEGHPPLATFAFSPLTDISFSGASVKENDKLEVFFPRERVGELAEMVLGGQRETDPRVSPLLADYPKCSPVFMQASDAEILQDDTTRMATHLANFGGEVTDDIWPDTPHVWQLFDGYLPESREALAQTAGFIRRMIENSAES